LHAHYQERFLVTGGCGYNGSHTLVSLRNLSNATNNNIEYSVDVVDSLANSSADSLRHVADISGLNFTCNADGTAGQDDTGRLVFHKVNCVHEFEFRPVFEEFASQEGFQSQIQI
jgi:UDP-glucose 4-epimerase